MRRRLQLFGLFLIYTVVSGCSSGPSNGGSTAAVARELAFSVPPSTILLNGPFHPLVTLQVRDTDGALVTGSSAVIDLHLQAGGGPGALTGVTSKAASSGAAVFFDLSLDQPGSYTLVATSTGLDSAVSATFTVDPLPTALTVEVGTAGGAIQFRSVRNGSVNPAVDTLASGGTVTWTWLGNGHTTHAVDGNFASSDVHNTPYQWPVNFIIRQTYRFNCGIHGNAMSGQIVVQ